ncbi:flavocytochrome c [Vagococcus xieshaowenii]|uniref:Flavocytochrome c n=1 Tax=Vagococcus xieshaowenii TaxID=2562451 RepID=A0AAJ5EG67_9ENTE|nr:flavocytochrome c [Vagococcus xieshaowenii]QCA28213.1 flavocytochrome c [Vagococcus xieshaowenii]TFZ42565.1 flavocytochrome c [Vagococcus xieshaowenii]
MKKTLLGILSLSTILLLGACGSQDKETASESSTTKESTEVTSGASATGTANFEGLKDKYDVVIIGAGGGGMSAAIEAKEKGLDPVIFEKMPVAGGNTLKASAGMNASETKFQKQAGIEDKNETFFKDTMKGGKETNDETLVHYLVDHSASAIDWLDSMGITLSNITTTGGMSVERTHRPADGSAVGQYLVAGLLRNLEERAIPLYTYSDVKEITMKDGKVSGVEVNLNEKEDKEIKADAVIVATGGFGANFDMLTGYNKSLGKFVTTNQPGSTGDGIKMAQADGADVVDMAEIQIHPTVEQDTAMLITEAVRGEGAILVSDEGKRFVNEMETRDNVSAAILELAQPSAYLIFDGGVKERVTAINFYEEAGLTTKAKSVAALASAIGLNKSTLEETVKEWNQSVADQTDKAFGRETGMKHDLSTGEFYAIKIAPGIHHTMGGLKINANTQVLDKDGKAIPGLFAAGEVTGGVHGKNRIGGNAVADIIVFGRQAGEQSAKYVNK